MLPVAPELAAGRYAKRRLGPANLVFHSPFRYQ
jgi:hypothetical protein